MNDIKRGPDIDGAQEKTQGLGEIKGRIGVFLTRLSGEETAMLRGELSSEDMGLLEGFFYGNPQGVSYALKQLSIKYNGKFDNTASKLQEFLTTIECADLAKRALFLGALRGQSAEEPKTEEIVRGSVTDVIEKAPEQVGVDDASSLAETVVTSLPKQEVEAVQPQLTSEPANQLEETAPIPTQPQDPIAQFLSSLTRKERGAIEIRRNFDLGLCHHGGVDLEALGSLDHKLHASGLTFDVVVEGVRSQEYIVDQILSEFSEEDIEVFGELIFGDPADLEEGDMQGARVINNISQRLFENGINISEPEAMNLLARRLDIPQPTSEPANQLEETAPIPTQPQDLIPEGFSEKATRGRKMTASPWGNRPSAESRAQLASQPVEITHKSGTAAFSVKGARGRKMTASPWGKGPSAEDPAPSPAQSVYVKTGAAFARKRKRGEKLTIPKFAEEISPALFKDVTVFFAMHIKTKEHRDVLRAVLDMVDPNNLKEMQRLIQEHARPDNKDAFMQMNNRIVLFIERIRRPDEEVRKALAIMLDGGHILPEVEPRKKGIDPRLQPTVPSVNVKRNIIGRILDPKRRGGKKK